MDDAERWREGEASPPIWWQGEMGRADGRAERGKKRSDGPCVQPPPKTHQVRARADEAAVGAADQRLALDAGRGHLRFGERGSGREREGELVSLEKRGERTSVPSPDHLASIAITWAVVNQFARLTLAEARAAGALADSLAEASMMVLWEERRRENDERSPCDRGSPEERSAGRGGDGCVV